MPDRYNEQNQPGVGKSNMKNYNGYCRAIIDKGNKLNYFPGYVGSFPVKAIKDSGANVILVDSKLVLQHEYTGENGGVKAFNGIVVPTKIARVFIKTPYITGKVLVHVVENAEIQLIIGNVKKVKRCYRCGGHTHLQKQCRIDLGGGRHGNNYRRSNKIDFCDRRSYNKSNGNDFRNHVYDSKSRKYISRNYAGMKKNVNTRYEVKDNSTFYNANRRNFGYKSDSLDWRKDTIQGRNDIFLS